MTDPTEMGRLFGTVADLYDDVRPEYPEELYDAIEAVTAPLDGLAVVDLAAGTGLQTRALIRRGAQLVAVDFDLAMLRRLRSTTPNVKAIVARAEQIPFRDEVADLVVCATAWHWLHTDEALAEIRRVLRPGGHFALWWGLNAWGDAVEWEDAQSAVFDRWDGASGTAPGVIGAAPRDAAPDLRARGIDVVLEQEFNWTRDVTREQHMRMLHTHSNNLARSELHRRTILAEIEQALQPWPTLTERLWGPLIVAQL